MGTHDICVKRSVAPVDRLHELPRVPGYGSYP